jgi:energy-coupling factor transporter ATP-binding protein EcfA2
MANAATTTNIVIYGPSGCGKSTHACALARHYGKTRIVDDWTPGSRLGDDTLALTNVPHQGAVPFLQAVTEARISLTPATVRRITAAVAHTAASHS